MSKKDYQALAGAIYQTRLKLESPPANVVFHVSDGLLGLAHATEAIADVLGAGNPRFSRERFLEACETGRCKGMRQVGAGA